MSGYRRFVAYVYEYRKGKKENNCGFVKVEVRDARCTMEVHLHCEGITPQVECRVYGFVRKDGLMDGVLLGSCETGEDTVECLIESDSLNMGDSGITLGRMGGMILVTQTGGFFGTEWDDQSIRPENFREMPGIGAEKSRNKQAVFGKEEQRDAASRKMTEQEPQRQKQSGEASPELQPIASNDGASEKENISEETSEENVLRMSGKSQREERDEMGENSISETDETQEKIDLSVTEVQEEMTRSKAVTPISPIAARMRVGKSVSNTAIHSNQQPSAAPQYTSGELYNRQSHNQNQLNYPKVEGRRSESNNPQVEGRRSEPNDPQVEGRQSESNNPQVEGRRSESNNPQGEGRRSEPNDPQGEGRRSEPNNPQGEGRRSEPNHPQGRSTQPQRFSNPTAPKPPIGEEYTPFNDGEFIQCWKIQPKSFVYFPRRECALRNNRFVMYGYYNFGHLLLGKRATGQYILGVPGGYDQQERFMANMFGFPYFKESPTIELPKGKGGYWYRLINAPNFH